jgi:hypothetical protein
MCYSRPARTSQNHRDTHPTTQRHTPNDADPYSLVLVRTGHHQSGHREPKRRRLVKTHLACLQHAPPRPSPLPKRGDAPPARAGVPCCVCYTCIASSVPLGDLSQMCSGPCEVGLRSKMPTPGRLKTPGTGRTVGCGAGARRLPGTAPLSCGDGRGVLEVPAAVDGPSTRRRSAPVRTSRCFWLQAGTIGGSARRLAPIGTPTARHCGVGCAVRCCLTGGQ